mmetsp:Transcript_76062/g.167961  ORF Transcript_76062/g.167961 Transcript_76062/m.167961 type:complete len:205 (+) Transcript_76062:982-1596(+)
MVIACRGHGAAHQLVVLTQAICQAGNARHEELGTLLSLAWVEEVQASVRAHRPIGMLTTAVDSSEWLLVEQNLQAHLCSLAVHDLHKKDVRVTGDVRHTKDWGHLMLPWCHLIVLHCHRATKPQHHRLNSIQKKLDISRNRSKVVEISLLMSGWQLTEQGSACVDQIRPCLVVFGLDHKEFLFPAQVAVDGLHIFAQARSLQQP